MQLPLEQLEKKIKQADAWLKQNRKHPRFFEYLTSFNQMNQALEAKNTIELRSWQQDIAPALKQLMEPPQDPKMHPWDAFLQKRRS